MTDFIDNLIVPFLNPSTFLGAFIFALLFLLLALIAARLVRAVTERNTRYFPDPTSVKFISQLLQVGTFLIAITLYAQLVPALRSFGTALLAGVSIVSIIVGLAAQSTLGNLIAGFAIIVYRPFQAGDQVQLATPKGLATGTVESVSLGYTFLRGREGERIIVPNSVMAGAVIIKVAVEAPPSN